KIKFRNPICESRWGFVLGGRKAQAQACSCRTTTLTHTLGLASHHPDGMLARVTPGCWSIDTHLNFDSTTQNNSSRVPLGKSMQSVSSFLVWCSTFSQGLIFHPQDAASTFFNEML
ncbi:hypothetical protein, partial [Pseudomonas sp. AGC67]